MSLGIQIKMARAQRRLKAKELAERADISPKYLSQIELDNVPGVSIAIFRRICEALEISADKLLELPDYTAKESID